MNPLSKAKAKYIAPIEEGELAVRIAEAVIGMKRPPDMTTAQVLASMPENQGVEFLNAARAAMGYWRECIDGANRSQ